MLLHFQAVDFYLDGQYMGDYLLRALVDGKRFASGDIFTGREYKDALYYPEIEALRSRIITDPMLELEYYFWKEEGTAAVYAIPRRFVKYGQP